MKKRHGGKKKRDAEASDSPAALHQLQSEPAAQTPANQTQEPTREKRSFSDWVNFSMAVFALLGLTAMFGSWRDSRESARQSDHANRPIIVVERVPAALALTPGKHLHRELYLVNGGKSTAHDVRLRSQSLFCTCEIEPDDSRFRAPSHQRSSVLIVPPRHRIGTMFDEDLTSEQIDLLVTGKARFYAFGEVHYRDDSNKERRARYCLAYYTKEPKRDPPQWSACHSNNFAG